MRVWNPGKTKLSRNPLKCPEQTHAELLRLILKIREGRSDLYSPAPAAALCISELKEGQPEHRAVHPLDARCLNHERPVNACDRDTEL
jgi:hypothetical protein